MTDSADAPAAIKVDARRPTAVDARIGQAIRARRSQLGLRLEDVARSLEITPHQLQKYETGGNRITASRLAECAKALNVPVAWFYQAANSEPVQTGGRLEFTQEELALVAAFRLLSPSGRDHIIGLAKLLSAGETQSKSTKM